jgi:hypothetical protein
LNTIRTTSAANIRVACRAVAAAAEAAAAAAATTTATTAGLSFVDADVAAHPLDVLKIIDGLGFFHR